MPARNTDPALPTEAAISLSAMATRCALSRTRFYQLIAEGIMPPPCHCLHTRRPLYPRELIDLCLQVRATNIGVNGRYILFYNRPQSTELDVPAKVRSRRQRRSVPAVNESLRTVREGLVSLGMATVSDEQIETSLQSAFPAGVNNVDPGTVLATVFRLLRSPQVANR